MMGVNNYLSVNTDEEIPVDLKLLIREIKVTQPQATFFTTHFK